MEEQRPGSSGDRVCVRDTDRGDGRSAVRTCFTSLSETLKRVKMEDCMFCVFYYNFKKSKKLPGYRLRPDQYGSGENTLPQASWPQDGCCQMPLGNPCDYSSGGWWHLCATVPVKHVAHELERGWHVIKLAPIIVLGSVLLLLFLLRKGTAFDPSYTSKKKLAF